MIEAEWLACRDRRAVLAFLTEKVTDRKLRLFACACCRRVWRLMRHEESRRAVEIAERFADGIVGDADRSEARRAAAVVTQARGIAPAPTDPRWERRAASSAYYAVAGEAAKAANGSSELAVEAVIWQNGGHAARDSSGLVGSEQLLQTHFLRDIFGNPFRPVEFSPAWRTDTAVTLAQQMYDAREFSAMPILADALQDAGCDSDDILDHCRGSGPHIRGCWVVDLVLGKE